MESVILIYSTVKMIELKNCNDIRKFNFNVFYFETYTLEWAECIKSPSLTLVVLSTRLVMWQNKTYAITLHNSLY